MEFTLAQINIAKMLDSLDSPLMAEFTSNLDAINALAEASEGFVWRLTEEASEHPGIKFFGDEYMLINLSVWQSPESLLQYVYKSSHGDFLKKRQEWFAKIPDMQFALWYIPKGHIPTIAEGVERLLHIQKNGETPFAFSFKKKFTPEEARQFMAVPRSGNG